MQTKAEEAAEYEFLEGVVESMRERQRRTVYRKVARGEDVLAHLVKSDGSDGSVDEADEGGEGGSAGDLDGAPAATGPAGGAAELSVPQAAADASADEIAGRLHAARVA